MYKLTLTDWAQLTGNLFIETSSIAANMVSEISTGQIVHDQVQILSILERIVHIDKKRIVQPGQDVSLIHDRFDATFGYDTCFAHLFQSEEHSLFFAFNAPYSAKTAFSNAEMIHKVCLADSYIQIKSYRQSTVFKY